MARAKVLVSRIALASAITSPKGDERSCVDAAKAETITGAEGAEHTIQMGGGSNTRHPSEVSLARGALQAGSEPGEESS
jgi:hypothetical protein